MIFKETKLQGAFVIEPEMLTDEHIHLDQNEMAGCGLDDFRALLLSWGQFTNGLR